MQFVAIYTFRPNGEEMEAHTSRQDWEQMMLELLTSISNETDDLIVQRVVLADVET